MDAAFSPFEDNVLNNFLHMFLTGLSNGTYTLVVGNYKYSKDLICGECGANLKKYGYSAHFGECSTKARAAELLDNLSKEDIGQFFSLAVLQHSCAELKYSQEDSRECHTRDLEFCSLEGSDYHGNCEECCCDVRTAINEEDLMVDHSWEDYLEHGFPNCYIMKLGYALGVLPEMLT